MGKDPSGNRLEEKADVFADVMNNLILKGRKVITEEELIPLPTRAYVRKMDGELRSGMRDVRMESRRNGILRLIMSIENQTEIDNTMPERVMGYEYSSYEEQVKQIMDENREKKKSAGSKRIFKSQKLRPVLTGVLYYGRRKWKSPLRLHEMLQFSEGMEEVLDVIWELSGEESYRILKEQIQKREIRKEKWTMCEMTQYVVQMGKAEGMKKGIEEGMKLTARHISNLGYSIQETARLCNVSLDTVQEWFAEWAQEV